MIKSKSSKLASSLGAPGRGVSHMSQVPSKFDFSVTVHRLEQMKSSKASLLVVMERRDKLESTPCKSGVTKNGTIEFEHTINMPMTLFQAKGNAMSPSRSSGLPSKSNPGGVDAAGAAPGNFEEKLCKFAVRIGDPKGKSVGKIHINIADYARVPSGSKKVALMLNNGAKLICTIRSTFLSSGRKGPLAALQNGARSVASSGTAYTRGSGGLGGADSSIAGDDFLDGLDDFDDMDDDFDDLNGGSLPTAPVVKAKAAHVSASERNTSYSDAGSNSEGSQGFSPAASSSLTGDEPPPSTRKMISINLHANQVRVIPSPKTQEREAQRRKEAGIPQTEKSRSILSPRSKDNQLSSTGDSQTDFREFEDDPSTKLVASAKANPGSKTSQRSAGRERMDSSQSAAMVSEKDSKYLRTLRGKCDRLVDTIEENERKKYEAERKLARAREALKQLRLDQGTSATERREKKLREMLEQELAKNEELHERYDDLEAKADLVKASARTSIDRAKSIAELRLQRDELEGQLEREPNIKDVEDELKRVKAQLAAVNAEKAKIREQMRVPGVY
ncbi:hypothetical protein FVE85_9274 [Porphyridium purpureum]|uniref:C2 NT-type domain-containing protein n=1 Tax=Porphyridium purpureum TaxID=35688 RepID=A0A5J4YQ74_PORPP|nr:hypothetical protein FVE85_9274 [Porphyridium purpureum]|eukprot:POR2166..scf222_8